MRKSIVLIISSLFATTMISGANYYSDLSRDNRAPTPSDPRQTSSYYQETDRGRYMNTDTLRTETPRDHFKTEQDKVILRKVREALSGQRGIDTRIIVIRVIDGKVSMEGRASSEQESRQLESIIRNVSGVGVIENRLVPIRNNPPGQRNVSERMGSYTSQLETSVTRERMNSNRSLDRNAQDRNAANNRSDSDSDLDADDQELLNQVQAALKGNGSTKNYSHNVRASVDDGTVTLDGRVRSEEERSDVRNRVRKIKDVDDIDDNLEINDQISQSSSREYSERREQMRSDAIAPQYGRQEYNLRQDAQAPREAARYTREAPQYRRDAEFRSRHSRPQYSGETDKRTEYTGSHADSVSPDSALREKIRDALKGGFFSKDYSHIKAEVTNGRTILQGSVDTEKDQEEILKRVHRIDGVRNIDNQIRVSASNARH